MHRNLRRDRLPAMAWAAAPANAPLLGAQSFSFRHFDFFGALAQLRALGLDAMEFCSVHFPPDAGHPEFSRVQAAIRDAGVTVPCFGVEGFTADEAANRKKFEFAKALGVRILTADPTPDSFDNLDRLCDEFGIMIAIHNHGPGARYDKVADTAAAVKDHSPLIGACVDTGHVIRSAEKPNEVIEQLGARVLSLHLKDWSFGGEEEILGQGDLYLGKVAEALDAIGFAGPLIMEYENSPDNPVPEMKLGFENWRKAVARA
ncbi:MAG: Sugar phosphate isomerase/epimerase [Candidatus Hydrogenedentes bacterium]|nr:Sugar phosphate isomerase/epimerase [Candidatus Hydrogenedentota bacterium]